MFNRKEKQDAFRFCYKFDCSSLQFSLLAPQSLYSVDEFGFDMLLPLMEAEVASFNWKHFYCQFIIFYLFFIYSKFFPHNFSSCCKFLWYLQFRILFWNVAYCNNLYLLCYAMPYWTLYLEISQAKLLQHHYDNTDPTNQPPVLIPLVIV